MDPMNPNPQMNPIGGSQPSMPATSPKDGNMGGMIAIAVIVALLAIGGWYYFNQVEGSLDGGDGQALENLQTQSESDEISDIEADVQATDLSGVDNTAAAINAELQ